MKRKIVLLILLISILLSACGASPDGNSIGSAHKNVEGNITVYFIDVGQSDAALILQGGHAMLIDGGDASSSNKIYSFLKELNITHLDYIVATHAHAEHVGGLSGALNYASAGVVFCPVTSYNTRTFENFIKYVHEQGKEITVPKAGDKFTLGSAEVTVLNPISPASGENHTNDDSIVLRIVFGDTSFLFTGDAERAAEAAILDSGYDLSSTVLKVGHHGSDTSTSYPFLREVMPEYAVISCGKDNMYGHPHENLLSRLRDADVQVFRTDMQGTITCISDGKTVTFQTERNADIKTNPTEKADQAGQIESNTVIPPEMGADGTYYIGNVNTHKFHKPDCPGLPIEKNRIYFATRETAIDEGYTPCGICNP